ncbi:MAG: peptidase S41, partial [Brevundimonas sp.]|nr:peptidase S41 [Brevundimonas sp.]
MKTTAAALALVAALACAGAGIAQEASPTVVAPADWGLALAEDARAFHDLIADSHPGPVDAENPGFGALLADGLRTALDRARTADSYADWYFALQEFSSSFDDGHLSLGNFQPMGHVWTSQWPGFLTGLSSGADGEQHRVVFNRDPDAPPVGAVLVGCDGRSAGALAEEMAGRAAGRWSLASRRLAYAPTVFIDQTNPYVRRPEQCVFAVDGVERTWNLVWRDLPAAVRGEGIAAARSPRHTAPIALRSWERGFWVELGGFDGDPDSADGVRLTPLKAEVAARADEIRAAPAVVFDLRGNNGGSSSWLRAMAESLWGEAWAAAHAPRSSGVEWRASAGNLATIESYKAQLGGDPEIMKWLVRITDGLTGTRAAGHELWLQADDDDDRPAAPAANPVQARTYVLTDYGCASACLDAVDL